MKILFFTPDFNYACGRSFYIFNILRCLKSYNIESVLVTNGGDSFDRLSDAGIKYYIDKSFFNRNLLKINYQTTLLEEIINRENINLIHYCHRLAEFISLRTIKKYRLRNLHTIFTALSSYTNRYYFEFKSDFILTVGNSIRNNLINNYNVKPEKIKLIPNFIIDEPESESKEISHNKNVFEILSIVRFHSDKGIDVLINTMKILKDQDIHLTLIGEGELENYILYNIRKYNLNISVIPPQRNLYKYYKSSDLCLLTSVIEPFPTFMLQAGYYNVPFAGTDIPGINELIQNNINGYLFPVNNSQKVTEIIMSIKNNPEPAWIYSENLSEEVLGNYTDKTIFPQILEVYSKLSGEI